MTTDPLSRGPLEGFIAGLPKAELHVHHVGSASPRIVAELAARHERHAGADRTPRRVAATSRSPTSRTSSTSTCRWSTWSATPEDVRMLTYEIARDMAETVRSGTPS